MSNKYKLLLEKAIEGNISIDEIDMVANALHQDVQTNTTSISTSTLLRILGRSYAIQYRHLVESLLDYKNDPWIARTALRVLCLDWGLAQSYSETIMKFMQGVSWDEAGDCNLSAINIAGEYLREHSDYQLLVTLFEMYRKETDELDKWILYQALARTVGRSHNEIPSNISRIDPLVIQAVELRLEKERRKLDK